MTREEVKSLLYPERSIYSVLGNLCKDPSLLREPEIQFQKSDFFKDIHAICFVGIYNLTLKNPERTSITAIELDNYWSESPKIYKEWEELDGYEYMVNSIENCDKDSFVVDYERVKKFSLLRAMVDDGLDIREVYDYQGAIDESIKKLDDMEISDILHHFSLKLINLKENYTTIDNSETFHIGDDIDTLLDRILEMPYGRPFRNQYYNTVFGGMKKGKFMLRSADTGTGKTRNNFADLVGVSATAFWSEDEQRFIENKYPVPALYIGTEEGKDEIQFDILSIISGVDPEKIRNQMLSKDDRSRLERAVEIMKESPFEGHWNDDFSIEDIEMIIEKHIIERNVEVVVFDYIQITPKITRNVLRDFGGAGVHKRDDQILEYFSSALKSIAERYEVFIMSGTQLNRNHKQVNMRDSASLAGGSSTSRKVDYGVQLYKVTEEDLQKLEPILETGMYETPNYSHWIYKNRGGKYDKVVIWSRMDLGIMHERVLFMTDTSYNLLNVKPTEIKITGEDEVEAKIEKEKPTMIDNGNPYIDE